MSTDCSFIKLSLHCTSQLVIMHDFSCVFLPSFCSPPSFFTGVQQPSIRFEDSASVFVAPQQLVRNLRFALGHHFSFGLQTRPSSSGSTLNPNRPVGDVVVASNHSRITRLAAILDNPPRNDVASLHSVSCTGRVGFTPQSEV